MNRITTSFLIAVLVSILFSCDPAWRVELVNLTGEEIIFSEGDLFCRDVFPIHYGDQELNTNINLQPGEGKSYTHYYGIGGWNKENQLIFVNYLDSIMTHHLDRDVKSESELTEFGNSLLIYTFK